MRDDLFIGLCISILMLAFTLTFLAGQNYGTTETTKLLQYVEVNAKKVEQPKTIIKDWHDGMASWYDYSLGHEDQKCTPDREPCYSQLNLTCASRDYPRGSILHVATVDDAIKCRVNDFGPAESTGRIIDLSSYAFSKLAPLKSGLIRVTVQEVK